MPAYAIARVDIEDWEQYQHYLKAVPAVIQKFGGKVIARGMDVVTLEGPAESRRIVILEFPSLERIKEFYHSAEYQQVKKLREGVSTGQLIALEGIS